MNNHDIASPTVFMARLYAKVFILYIFKDTLFLVEK